MLQINMPFEKLNAITASRAYDSKKFEPSLLEAYGIFVLRHWCDEEIIERYRRLFFDELATNQVVKNTLHQTEFNFSERNQLNSITEEQAFLNLSENFYQGNVGLYNNRIIAKLDSSECPVFLHQDSCYHFGSDQKYSFFIPLVECGPHNGGITFVPGSHHFGYMGDAGALKECLAPAELTLITPNTFPGDLVVMNSHVWHRSSSNEDGSPRIYFDIHICDARAPFSKRTLCGINEAEYSIAGYSNDELFESSRYQRLRNQASK